MSATTLASAPYPVLRRAALATGGVFALSGAVSATWISRLPEVRTALSADPGSLGVALLGSAIGSVAAAPLTGRVAARFGSRIAVAGSVVVCMAGLVGLGLVHSVVALGLTLVVFGFGFGSWDVAMNIHGHGVEAAAGRAWMPRYHAVWSVGGFVAAGIGSAAAGAHLPVPAHFAIAAAVLGLGTFGLLTLFLRDGRHATPAESVRSGAEASRPRHAGRILTWPFVMMGVVMACATLVEGAASDWLGIYFNDVRSASPAASSAAFTVFAIAMAASRAAGTWTIGRLGRGRAVRFSALLAMAGVVVLLLSPVTAGAYVGAAMWGLGTAIVFPAVISAAGDTPGRSAEAIALVTPIGYTGFLVGPPLVGMIARHTGLEHALWLIGALAAVMALLAGVTRERRPGAPAPVEP
ncbi:MFS transporter [Actinocatenispora rupis]|uniref:MFS transporter n=1 Tax=Actinocatenispora rupis TaxID=519421 RepID=A0A8J3N8Z6_9ACTN|nr:MFS transporter [Actinocatenispora rupis]GID10834.1 MFS transporter [Actinocatenispora rupis]